MSTLEGLKVLDFSHALAGPYATLMLADHGADVYKLEAPGGSDMGRGWGPPFIGGEAAFFLGLNRGKQGLAINLRKPEGVDLCLRLLDRMDVLIENFRPGTMQRLGLGYETVHARNSRLVYCSISGYGQDGPARNDAAMDLIVQCSSGLVSMTGTEAGDQVRCGYSVADVTTGMFAVIAILMALRARDQTGRGQFLDVAMQDCMISVMTSNYMTFFGSGKAPRPLGTAFATVVPYRVFQASDRGVAIAVGSEKLWTAFCQAIEHPELEHHPDYATNADRSMNRPALETVLAEVFRHRSAAEWIDRLRGAGVPCTMVLDFSEVTTQPQSEFREMFPMAGHATAGPHRVTGTPLRFSETPGRAGSGAPLPGQHSAAILESLLGLGKQAFRDLCDQGVIG